MVVNAINAKVGFASKPDVCTEKVNGGFVPPIGPPGHRCIGRSEFSPGAAVELCITFSKKGRPLGSGP